MTLEFYYGKSDQITENLSAKQILFAKPLFIWLESCTFALSSSTI